MRERVDTPSPKWRLRVESCRRARKQSGVKKTGPASWIRTPMPRNKPGSRKKVRALFLQQPLCVCVRGRGKHRDVASPHTRVFRHHHERTNPVATNITPQSLAHKHAIPTPLFPPPPPPRSPPPLDLNSSQMAAAQQQALRHLAQVRIRGTPEGGDAAGGTSREDHNLSRPDRSMRLRCHR